MSRSFVRPSVATCIALALSLGACSAHPATSAPLSDGGSEEPIAIPVPDGGSVTWDGWAGEFVSDYCVSCHNPASTTCAGSACHPANGPVPDFRERSAVFAYAPTIRCGVASHQDPSWKCGSDIVPDRFPLATGTNPLPTEEQREMFVGWLDGGCP